MAYDQDTRPPRPMNDVSSLGLTCGECGTEITELPFQPTKKEDGTYGTIYCFECNKKRKPQNRSMGGGGFRQGGARPPRQIHDVSSLGLTCSECGTEITQLPFQPTMKDDGTYGKLFCRDCNRKRFGR